MKNRFFTILGWIFAFCLLLILLSKQEEPKQIPAMQSTQSLQPTQLAQTSTQIESKPLKPSSNKTQTFVSRVIDGDTVELSDGDRVRLIGIDTPEKGKPYFKEAKNKLVELAEGKTVKLEKDISEKDKYGRRLRYIWLDGVLINLEMVRQGFAFSYTYPPDVRYQDKILAAQKQAQEQHIGLWALTDKKDEEKGPYVASRTGEVFHYPSCPRAKRISAGNKENLPTRRAAIQAGFRPCHVCNP